MGREFKFCVRSADTTEVYARSEADPHRLLPPVAGLGVTGRERFAMRALLVLAGVVGLLAAVGPRGVAIDPGSPDAAPPAVLLQLD